MWFIKFGSNLNTQQWGGSHSYDDCGRTLRSLSDGCFVTGELQDLRLNEEGRKGGGPEPRGKGGGGELWERAGGQNEDGR